MGSIFFLLHANVRVFPSYYTKLSLHSKFDFIWKDKKYLNRDIMNMRLVYVYIYIVTIWLFWTLEPWSFKIYIGDFICLSSLIIVIALPQFTAEYRPIARQLVQSSASRI